MGACLVSCDGMVNPRLAVVPMWWSQALYFCQNASCPFVGEAEGIVQLLNGHYLCPDFNKSVSSIYVNNIMVICVDARHVSVTCMAILSVVHGRGLATHEDSCSTNDADLF